MHRIELGWSRHGQSFSREDWPRDHRVRFDGGEEVGVSAAAAFGGNTVLADPEQLLLAALASCHLLSFLAVAARRGHVVEHYSDQADAELGRNTDGRTWVSRCTLRPDVRFAQPVPDAAEQASLHEKAHRICFIAQSLRCEVRVEPV
jgi:organic hydroperoxide reductase OsmC/OhrA